jgi:hypothetical protein
MTIEKLKNVITISFFAIALKFYDPVGEMFVVEALALTRLG